MGALSDSAHILVANDEGTLQVWEQPASDGQYVIGVDCAGGGAKSDFAVAVVLNMADSSLAALMQKREDAPPWAARCVHLARYFNEANLVFETYPSAHGLSAARHAVDVCKYQNVYRHLRSQVATLDPSANLGWQTHENEKRQMIDRVKLALASRHKLRSKDVVQNLRARRWIGRPEDGADKWKIGGKGHDDIFVAYAIAGLVRDQTYVEGGVVPTRRTSPTQLERVWEQHAEEMEQYQGAGSRHLEFSYA